MPVPSASRPVSCRPRRMRCYETPHGEHTRMTRSLGKLTGSVNLWQRGGGSQRAGPLSHEMWVSSFAELVRQRRARSHASERRLGRALSCGRPLRPWPGASCLVLCHPPQVGTLCSSRTEAVSWGSQILRSGSLRSRKKNMSPALSPVDAEPGTGSSRLVSVFLSSATTAAPAGGSSNQPRLARL